MKINFVNSIEPYVGQISKCRHAEVGTKMKYTLDGVMEGGRLYTRGMNTCTSFNIHGKRRNLMGHISPEGFNTRTFAQSFERLIKDFMDKYGNVQALVFGGRESSYVDPRCDVSSNEVFATICDVLSTKCDIPDKNFASILGKYSDVKSFDNMAVLGNTVYLANNEFAKLGLEKANKKEIPNLLGGVYEDVEVPLSLLA